MNGDFDLYVLNGKIKELKESNNRQETDLEKIKNDITLVGEKMDNLSIDVDLSGLNSTIGTEYFRTLDQIISATMILEGASGTKFDITNTTTDETFSVTLASGESKIIVPVPLGTYTIKVTFSGKSTTVNLTVDTLGKPYKVTYYIQLASFSSNGTFVVPAGLTKILVDASAGGGGGGAGGEGNKSGTSGVHGSGGGGGGGGKTVTKRVINVFGGETISITVGAAGKGGTSRNSSGTSGGATVIGSKLTLAGGGYGTYGKGLGNAAGTGGSPNGKSGTVGTQTSAGVGGQGGSPNGGKGGDGSASSINAGKDGGSGYVIIYTGVA